MLMALKGNLDVGTSCEAQGVWCSRVWTFCVPNKVRIFLWMACKNILPIMANLCVRMVVGNVWCPFV